MSDIAKRVEDWLSRGRCGACGWTLAASASEGCVPGDCAYRPDDPAEKRQRSACLAYLAERQRKGLT